MKRKYMTLAECRRTILSTYDKNGNSIRLTGLNKRKWKGHCELCKRKPKNPYGTIVLEYHHWILSKPEIGMWLCYHCHNLAELIDRGYTLSIEKKYNDFKDEITKKYKHKSRKNRRTKRRL